MKKSERTQCAIYTRKSTEEGLDKEFNSLDAQREAAEAFIALGVQVDREAILGVQKVVDRTARRCTGLRAETLHGQRGSGLGVDHGIFQG